MLKSLNLHPLFLFYLLSFVKILKRFIEAVRRSVNDKKQKQSVKLRIFKMNNLRPGISILCTQAVCDHNLSFCGHKLVFCGQK